MNILILGGTVFVGRALVEVALKRGHYITLFNRGQSNSDLFPSVEHLKGDRDGNLTALQGRRWDAVIDTCGYVPRIVAQSVQLLADAVKHYTFISTISVYADTIQPNNDETYTLGTLVDETVEEITGETYGPLKVLCEKAVETGLANRNLIIRPGLIVGPYDPTDRFSYWPHRVAKGGEVLVPSPPTYQIQVIDVRDLAEWTITMIEKEEIGIYNTVGPATPLTMQTLLQTSQAVSHSDATFTWVDEAFLLAQEVAPWQDLPLWIPESDPNMAGFYTVKADKAIAMGLQHRPLAETVEATLAWLSTRPTDYAWRVGLSREREQAVLSAWHHLKNG